MAGSRGRSYARGYMNGRRRRAGFVKYIVMALVVVIIIGMAGGSLYFYDLAVARGDKGFLGGSNDLGARADDDAAAFSEAFFGLDNEQWEELSLTSHDGLALKALYIPAREPTQKVAIVAHGYAGEGGEMAAYAQMYHEWGYGVLLPDLRGHGASEGDYLGFGWPDRLDLLEWIGAMIDREGEEVLIVLHGVSMGAAAVLMASGEVLPGQVKAVVSDCAYTSAKDELSYQMGRLYGLPAFPLVDTTSLVCRLRAGYFFGEASALAQVKKSQTPTLFIHGTADTFVPFSMLAPLYDACAAEKEMWAVEGAGHGEAFDVDSEEYAQKVAEFIGRYVGEDP